MVRTEALLHSNSSILTYNICRCSPPSYLEVLPSRPSPPSPQLLAINKILNNHQALRPSHRGVPSVVRLAHDAVVAGLPQLSELHLELNEDWCALDCRFVRHRRRTRACLEFTSVGNRECHREFDRKIGCGDPTTKGNMYIPAAADAPTRQSSCTDPGSRSRQWAHGCLARRSSSSP